MRVTLENGKTLEGETWDVSDGGIALQMESIDPTLWKEGMLVTGQVQGLPVEAPKIKLKVIRVEASRIGLAIAQP
jgi:hypothetical protein